MAPFEQLSRWNDRVLAALARTTSSGRFVPEIDGLRFFAILGVALFHVNGYLVVKGASTFGNQAATDILSTLFAQGGVGVRLFFVISGFILAVPFAEHHLRDRPAVPLRTYFRRRLTRLEPPYIANLLVLAVLEVLVRPVNEPIPPHLAASMVYLHNVVFGEGSTINYVAWSLEVEVQWYLLAPLACMVFAIRSPSRRRLTLLAMIVALGALAAQLSSTDWPRGSLSILGFGHFFAGGMILAELWLTRWREPSRHRLVWDAAGIAGWIALLPMDARPQMAPFEVAAILLAYAGCLRGRILNAVVRNRWLVTIGGMCYTIYLYHGQVISSVGRLTLPLTPRGPLWLALLIQMALILPVVLVFSAVLFVTLEKPFMAKDWPKRAFARLNRSWVTAVGRE